MSELLKRVGWTQKYFARLWGVDENTVGRWCKGDPNYGAMRYLECVARMLGV